MQVRTVGTSHWGCLGTLVGAIAVAGTASGQTADSVQDEQAVLEEIIVTAQKRSESVQDVPISINVISGEDLHRQSAFTTDDISKLFTNLSLKTTTPIISGFSIRGVGTDNVHPVAQQAVGQYHDEVGIASPHTGSVPLMDLERVEVLRGPQNTLFGRNTTGGAINFIARKPEVGGEQNGYARVRAGNAGRLDFDAAFGAPVGDNAAVRVALQSHNRDGIFYDQLDGDELGAIERVSARVQLAWAPSDDTEVLFGITDSNSGGTLPPNKGNGTLAANGVDPCPSLTSGTSQWAGPTNCFAIEPVTNNLVNISTRDWHTVENAAPHDVDVDVEIASLRIVHQFDGFELTSISAYEFIDVEQFYSNWSGSRYVGFIGGSDSFWEVFSQEVRLASTTDDRLQWILGGFFSTEDDRLATLVRNGAPGLPPQTVLPSVDVEQTVDIMSIYGQIDYDISDRLSFGLGLRITDDSKSGDSTVRNMVGTDTGTFAGTRLADDATIPLTFRKGITDAPGVGACPGLPCKSTIPVEQSLSELGGKINVNYAFSENALGYASYSRGFKSGAFDTRALAAFVGTADQPVGPEFLDAYEVGIKSTLSDGAIEFNAAAFYYDWEDMQIFDSDPQTGAPAFLNIPLVRIVGGEFDVRWLAGNGWYVQGGLGLLNSAIKATGGLLAPTLGSRITDAPETTLNGLIRKDFDLNNGSTLSLQTDFRYRGEESNTLNEDPAGYNDPVSFFNARAMLIFGENDQYDLSVWGENITDEKSCLRIADIGSLTYANMCTPNDGMAFYGATLQVNF